MKKLDYLMLEDIQAISDVVVKINEIIEFVNDLDKRTDFKEFINKLNDFATYKGL